MSLIVSQKHTRKKGPVKNGSRNRTEFAVQRGQQVGVFVRGFRVGIAYFEEPLLLLCLRNIDLRIFGAQRTMPTTRTGESLKLHFASLLEHLQISGRPRGDPDSASPKSKQSKKA